MRIGVMGGTFDPIHLGHLILGRDARDALDLHKLIFVPNHRSPHKLGGFAAPPELRAAMVRAAIEGEHGFEVDEVEVLRGGASYAIDTILHLRVLNPEAEFFYLIGEDNLRGIAHLAAGGRAASPRAIRGPGPGRRRPAAPVHHPPPAPRSIFPPRKSASELPKANRSAIWYRTKCATSSRTISFTGRSFHPDRGKIGRAMCGAGRG